MVKKLLPYLTLFTSLSTLVCCALPALFVSLGFGASLAALLGTFPQLIWLSEHKLFVFLLAGLLLVTSGIFRSYASARSCPTDQKLADACGETRKYSTLIYWFSILAFFIGGFFAFVAPGLL